MPIDSRAKGARGETVARDALRSLTGLNWERVPGSGALDPKHMLKGDLYIPNCNNAYCVEVKNYADDQISTKLLTGKSPLIIDWWEQALRQGKQVDKKPLLIFKHDRSKLFAAFEDEQWQNYRKIKFELVDYEFSVALLDDFVKHENPQWQKALNK